MQILALYVHVAVLAVVTHGMLGQTTDGGEVVEGPASTSPTPDDEEIVVTTTVAPEITTPPMRVILNRCAKFRPHPQRLDRARFQMEALGIWYDFICQAALVWDQIECSCNWPRFILSSPCAGYRSYPDDAMRYQQWSNGVWITKPCNGPGSNLNLIWYQERCWCDFPPTDPTATTGPTPTTTPPRCIVMLDATFNRGIFEDGPKVYTVGRIPWHGVRPENGTAVVQNAMLIVWGFKGNDLTDAFNIRIRFKPDADSPNRDKYVGLVANRCAWGPSSLEIGFKQTDRTYTVTVNTGAIEKFTCQDLSTPDPSGWIRMEFQFTEGFIMLTVNDQTCFTDVLLGTTPRVSGCAMTFGGDELSAGFANMYGRFDRILIRKVCYEPEPW